MVYASDGVITVRLLGKLGFIAAAAATGRALGGRERVAGGTATDEVEERGEAQQQRHGAAQTEHRGQQEDVIVKEAFLVAQADCGAPEGDEKGEGEDTY